MNVPFLPLADAMPGAPLLIEEVISPQAPTRLKLALVTGASRGIGKGVAIALKRSGFQIAGLSLCNRADDADLWLQVDVGSEAAVTAAVSEVVARFGRIDVVVNAAGVAEYALLADTSIDLWNKIMTTNVTGTFLVMQKTLPILLAGGGGRIVNVSSIAGKRGEPQMAAYSASKHAIIGLTRAAALQYAKSGITVNAICPASVDTEMLAGGLQSWALKTGRSVDVARKIFRAASPQDRFLDIEEIAGTVSYLVSDAARGMNGQAINICGGATFY